MPIFMDVHIIPGVKARGVAEAHQKDLLHQEEYGCKCMTYWIDEGRETVFCLIEAPHKMAVEELHNRAHGLMPNKIIEVDSAVVESFLGRIYDPESIEATEGLKVFNDSSFRILLVTHITDPVLLKHQLGKVKAGEVLNAHTTIIRRNLLHYGGREIEHGGNGFIISFTSAAKAVSCALAIQNDIAANLTDTINFKISIVSGEPVESNDLLFGDTLQLAQYIGMISRYRQLALASSVKKLVSKDYFLTGNSNFFTLMPQDEELLQLLFHRLEDNCQDPHFNVEDYCQEVAMSKSQLYRKCISLTGLSPSTSQGIQARKSKKTIEKTML